MEIMSIKAVIFDADEMIIKREEYFSVRLGQEYGIPAEKILPFFKGEFQKCIIGQGDLKEEISPYLVSWRYQGTVDELLDYWFKSEQDIDTRVVKEIKKLRVAGIKCYLATKQEKYRTEYLKNNLGFKDLFDGIYSSCEMGCKKPDRDFFEYINDDLAQKENFKPDEIMF